jgi:Mrp family chromosome partitioning ATPase
MREVLATLKRDFRPWTVILDLPPMLLGDDVLAVLPLVDCALLVTAVGTTTTAEVEECNRYLQSTSVVRVVVNKVPDWNNRYY